MAITVRPSGNVCILEFKDGAAPPGEDGALPTGMVGQRLSDLGRTVGRLLDAGSRRFLLDLAPVNYVDSAGFGELIACLRRTQRQGGELRLLHVTGKVRERLDMLHLTGYFQIYEEESLALASFRGKTPRARRPSHAISPPVR